MKFENRNTAPPQKKLTKVDIDNNPIPNEEPFYVRIERCKEDSDDGTPLTAENLNKGNWRDNDHLSFRMMDSNDLPPSRPNETRIVTKTNGETWIIPPFGFGMTPKVISDPVDSLVTVAGIKKNIDFVSDPQIQIDEKSTVKVNNVKEDIYFISDPQEQIDRKADWTAIEDIERTVDTHITNKDNPHNVTKIHIGLDSVDNTADVDKPVSLPQQNALNLKADRNDSGQIIDSLYFYGYSWETATARARENEGGYFECLMLPHDVNNIFGNNHATVKFMTSGSPYIVAYAKEWGGVREAVKVFCEGSWGSWIYKSKHFVTIYDAGRFVAGSDVGIKMNGNTTAFGEAHDGDVFRIQIYDRRLAYIQTALISFRYNNSAMVQYDSPYDGFNMNSIGYRVRTYFVRPSLTVMNMQTQASRVSSDGSTNWYSDNCFSIVKIEKEM